MILFHGCWGDAGHYWFGPGKTTSSYGTYPFRRRHDGVLMDDPYCFVPWGYHVDGGLAPHGKLLHVEGAGAFAQSGRFLASPEEEWWTAISWWDNSLDTRPASNITIVIDQKVEAEALLIAARVTFAERFEIIKYAIALPPASVSRT